MNIISCDGCGVVLDKDKINFPEPLGYGGSVMYSNVTWDEEEQEWVGTVPCPACGEPIPEK